MGIDEFLDAFLKECEKMSPEELDKYIQETLNTPLGRYIKQQNDEAIEAVQEMERNEGRYLECRN